MSNATGAEPRAAIHRGERWLTAGTDPGVRRVVTAALASSWICVLAAAVLAVAGQRSGFAVALAEMGAAIGPVIAIGIRSWAFPEGRVAWAWVGGAVGLNLWNGLFANAVGPTGADGAPLGWADVFALPASITLLVGVFLLTQRGLGRVHTSVRLDSLTAGTGFATVALAVGGSRPWLAGRSDAIGLGFCYPLIDLALCILLIAGLAPRRYRPTWSSGLLMAGVAVIAAGDVARLSVSHGPSAARWLALARLAGFALIGLAAWAPGRYRRPVAALRRSSGQLVVPAGFGLVALAVMVGSPLATGSPAVPFLAASTIVLALGRTLWTVRDLDRLGAHAEEANTDELTKLPNRRAFFEQLDRRLIAPLVRHAVLVVDLDGFKEVNDTLGHAAGDDLLRCVSQRLRHRLPDHIALARMGGDEFALVAPVVSEAEAVLIGRMVTAALSEPFRLQSATVTVGASCGVAVQPDHGQDRETLLHAADVAMYEAKRGRTGVVAYRPSEHHHGEDDAQVTALLADALAHGRIELHYQPVLRTDNGALCTVEALLRWAVPARGVLPVAEVMALATKADLHGRLSRVVAARAIELASSLHRQGLAVPFSINVGAADLNDADLVGVIGTLLGRAGLPPSLFAVEIDERVMVAHPERAGRWLAAVRDLGVAVVVDHFEANPATLSLLGPLGVRTVKLSAQRVAAAGDDLAAQALLEATIHVAQRFGVSVVGLGVEDAQGLAVLTRTGCEQAQGIHLLRPVTSHGLLRYLGQFHRNVDPPVVEQITDLRRDAGGNDASRADRPEPAAATGPDPVSPGAVAADATASIGASSTALTSRRRGAWRSAAELPPGADPDGATSP